LDKRLIFLLIIILGICIFIPLITAYAEDDEIPAGESPAIESDLLDFSELSQYRDEQGLKNLEPHSHLICRSLIYILQRLIFHCPRRVFTQRQVFSMMPGMHSGKTSGGHSRHLEWWH
jgi:hypothetical protein